MASASRAVVKLVLFHLHSLFVVSPSDSSERLDQICSSFVRERRAETLRSPILIHLKQKKQTSDRPLTLWLLPQ